MNTGFEYADHSYKTLQRFRYHFYDDGKPTRILGAIRDVTAEKQLSSS